MMKTKKTILFLDASITNAMSNYNAQLVHAGILVVSAMTSSRTIISYAARPRTCSVCYVDAHSLQQPNAAAVGSGQLGTIAMCVNCGITSLQKIYTIATTVAYAVSAMDLERTFSTARLAFERCFGYPANHLYRLVGHACPSQSATHIVVSKDQQIATARFAASTCSHRRKQSSLCDAGTAFTSRATKSTRSPRSSVLYAVAAS